MWKFFLATLLIVGGLSEPALAQTANCDCHELSTAQVWVGYLSWMGFFKGLGVLAIAGGIFGLFGHFILTFVVALRHALVVLGFVVSIGLVVGAYWLAPDYQLWPVMIGCLGFMASIFAYISVWKIQGDDPKTVAAILTIAWGAAAAFYNLVEIGILANLALVTFLGFSVVVGRLSYGFGWHEDAKMRSGTAAALLLLAVFVAQKAIFPHAPAYVQVFATGTFWVGSIVAFTGLLIMSSKWYDMTHSNYLAMQLITIIIYVTCIAVGMILHINPLAGAAGVFLAFYVAAKPMEISDAGFPAFCVGLIITGALMSGIWYVARQHEQVVYQYLTTTLS